MATWKEFELLCKDIKQNPDKYNWIVVDSLLGIAMRKAEKDAEVYGRR